MTAERSSLFQDTSPAYAAYYAAYVGSTWARLDLEHAKHLGRFAARVLNGLIVGGLMQEAHRQRLRKVVRES